VTESAETSASPVVERESSVLRSSRGARFMKQVSVVRPRNHLRLDGALEEPSTERVRTAQVGLEEDQHRLREDERNVVRARPGAERWRATGRPAA
jgi:hypothetical protein